MPTLAVVLSLIRERGAVSRVELAGATGFTQATMTRAVRKLEDLDLVHEVGTVPSNQGKPRRLVGIKADARYMIGLQFDAYSGTGVVVDLAGGVVAQRDLIAPGLRPPETVIAELAEAVRLLLKDAAVPRDRVLGVGLATYGPQDRKAGVLLTPQPTPDWQGHPLAVSLSKATGIPVAVENDATAAGIGIQTLSGAASSFVVVYMCGGIGAGLILDGQPYRGVTSNGLELGHISVDALGPQCTCGNRGCLDTAAGPTAVMEQALADPLLAGRIESGAGPLAAILSIGRAALDGDAAAADLIDASAQKLAIATVTLVNLFDIGRVVLAGRAFADLGPTYRDTLQAILDQAVFMRHVHATRVELAPDVTQAAAIGAATVVLRNLLESPDAP
ncbi:ROK family transcriptional regulator [Glycomyces algeriensis]|nr:ROK family transcriptional regulator [Glycomyces algeriensis]MDA1364297.1 ROK family transcriptional regulator [Glycomyces algeriensis]MDR7350328.1 putative NBD/HSP70 family sugar kinase [Glycomyces algeriensis]